MQGLYPETLYSISAYCAIFWCPIYHFWDSLLILMYALLWCFIPFFLWSFSHLCKTIIVGVRRQSTNVSLLVLKMFIVPFSDGSSDVIEPKNKFFPRFFSSTKKLSVCHTVIICPTTTRDDLVYFMTCEISKRHSSTCRVSLLHTQLIIPNRL